MAENIFTVEAVVFYIDPKFSVQAKFLGERENMIPIADGRFFTSNVY